MKLPGLILTGLLSSFSLAAEADFQFKAEDLSHVELKGNARVEDGVLKLDGNKSYVVLKSSQAMHLTEQGMTLTATVKFKNNGTKGGTPEAHDMIISKGRDFIFGRSGNRIYFNFHDGSKWVAPLMTGKAPSPDQWAHVAVTLERINDTAQGDVGYVVSIFINGEPEARQKFLYAEPKASNEPIQIGNGFGGGPWFFNGEIAEAAMYGRALTDGEIFAMASNAPLVKISRKGFTEINPQLLKQLQALNNQAATPEARWLVLVLERAAKTGYDQKSLSRTITDSGMLLKQKMSAEELAGQWNARKNGLPVFLTDNLLALAANGNGESGFPLYGILNRQSGAPVFGEKTLGWEIIAERDGKKFIISDTDAQWRAATTGNRAEITWSYQDKLIIKSNLVFTGPRLEISWQLNNQADDILVKNVQFPSLCLARQNNGNDTLVHPRMSGVLAPNPTVEQYPFGQEGWYPSSAVTMQFGAYYDRAGGIYFAFEDPAGRSKYYSAKGKRGNLHISWQSPVKFDAGRKGGNSFSLNGSGVVEVFSGNWFDAGQIYKRFLAEKSQWWIKELPRASTPQWFRDNTLWILEWTKTPESAIRLKNELMSLRKYFELPLGLHWYSWDDLGKGSWPHFHPKDFSLEMMKELQTAGIYAKPYINSRLWAEKDGPGRESNWMFNDHGRKYAVKHEDGSPQKEVYKPYAYFVMCPAAKGWQDWVVNLTDRVAGYGFNAIYHDQVGTARPIICFNPSHNHPLNDGSVWLEQGYWPMFERIRKLKEKYPELCHDTEEAAEPYLQYMDGYMVWRWTDYNQVPLYTSIYSGRSQFTGRLYNHQSPGDTASFFIKAAEQLVYSEQLGWFTMPDMHDGNKRLFIKKLMHIRYALLDYFNAGSMLKPLDFKEPLPEITTKWGATNAARMIKTPKVQHSVWQGRNGLKMILFVNSVDEPQTFTPKLKMDDGMVIGICREGVNEPVIMEKAPPVLLKNLNSEVWVTGKRAAVEKECMRLAKVMDKISKFDAGASPARKRNP